MGRLFDDDVVVVCTGDLLVFTDGCEGILDAVCCCRCLEADGASFALFRLDSTYSSKDMSLLSCCTLVVLEGNKRFGLGEHRFRVGLV